MKSLMRLFFKFSLDPEKTTLTRGCRSTQNGYRVAEPEKQTVCNSRLRKVANRIPDVFHLNF